MFASAGPAEDVRVANNLAAEADSLAELRAHAAFAFVSGEFYPSLITEDRLKNRLCDGYSNLSINNDAVTHKTLNGLGSRGSRSLVYM